MSDTRISALLRTLRLAGFALILLMAGLAGQAARAAPVLEKFLTEVDASELAPGADGFGPIRS
nr:hypothetical protein [Paracoccus sp. (in: a-proteobacteria)]